MSCFHECTCVLLVLFSTRCGEGEERLGLFPKPSGEFWISVQIIFSLGVLTESRNNASIMIAVWGRDGLELECTRTAEMPTERQRSALWVLCYFRDAVHNLHSRGDWGVGNLGKLQQHQSLFSRLPWRVCQLTQLLPLGISTDIVNQWTVLQCCLYFAQRHILSCL